MSNSKDLTSVIVTKIIGLKEGGCTITEMCWLTGVGHTSVKKYSHLLREGGSDEPPHEKPRFGRPLKISKHATNILK